MTKFILRWAIYAIALYLAVFLVPGVMLEGGSVLSFVWLALIFRLLNALVRPLITLLTCPLIILTLGLGTLLINTLTFYLAVEISQLFNIGFAVADIRSAFLGALVITIVSIILSLVLRVKLNSRRRKGKRR